MYIILKLYRLNIHFLQVLVLLSPIQYILPLSSFDQRSNPSPETHTQNGVRIFKVLFEKWDILFLIFQFFNSAIHHIL